MLGEFRVKSIRVGRGSPVLLLELMKRENYQSFIEIDKGENLWKLLTDKIERRKNVGYDF